MSARRRQTHLSRGAVLAVLGCISLAGCGDGSNDSKLLSPSSASELRATLAQVEHQVENGDCAAAREQVSLLDQQVSSLDRIEADLRDALTSGTSRLQQLVNEECPAAATETGTTGATGTTDTGGTTGPDEQQSEEQGKGKKEKKDKKDKKNQDQSGDESGGQQDEAGSGGEDSGGSGTTGSGGLAP